MNWKRSTRCETSACVEVLIDGDVVKVRDSKNPDVVLEFTTDEWDAFVGGCTDGEFNLD